MKPAGRGASGALVRRIVQTAALLLFFGLVFCARRPVEGEPTPWLPVMFWIDPLVAALTWLSAHVLPAALAWSLVTLAVTALLGRVFCGWICPLGTIHALAGRVLEFCWPRRKKPEHWSPWQSFKYYLLGAIVLMAACGVHWGAALDPLVLLYRTTTVALLPGMQWMAEDGSAAMGFDEPVQKFLREHVTEVSRQALLGSGPILGVFLAMLVMNRYRHRFWCRYVCPLGAMLGVFSLRPFLQRRVEPSSCNQCDLCGIDCHGAAAAGPGEGWKAAECFGCLNCTDSCRRDALAFRLTWTWQTPPQPAPATLPMQRSRRRFLSGIRATAGTLAGGMAGMMLFRATPQSRGTTSHQGLIRPPGSLAEREFLNRCTACGMCMKICPTGCIQPVWAEAGLEGLWTPVVVARIGRCEYDCTLCGHVCPTGAIQPLSVAQKHEVRLGIAMLDHSKCIPYAYGLDCGTCVEACPISPKAIRLVDVEVSVHDGKRQSTRVVGQPIVDPNLCVGCGGCVSVCTFKDEPAIHVVAANESRHPEIKPFLDGGAKPSASPAAAESDPYGK